MYTVLVVPLSGIYSDIQVFDVMLWWNLIFLLGENISLQMIAANNYSARKLFLYHVCGWLDSNVQYYLQYKHVKSTNWQICSLLGQLDRPATLNDRVAPVSFPDPNAPNLPDFARCTVSGWGITSLSSYNLSPVLRSVDVDVFNSCWYYYYFKITDNMMCAGSLFGGRDSCQVRHNDCSNIIHYKKITFLLFVGGTQTQ